MTTDMPNSYKKMKMASDFHTYKLNIIITLNNFRKSIDDQYDASSVDIARSV